MRVCFIFFASIREAAGVTREEAELPEGATAGDALRWLVAAHPALERLLPTVRVAVNRDFARLDARLSDGDEVVIVPPISGGSGARALLTDAPIDREAATRLIATDGAGAIVTFAGVVRPTSRDGRAVTDLFYEAYTLMAEAKLEQCLAEAAAGWPITDAAVVHRLGALRLGDVAVSIAVAAAHRKEAFRACEHIIDRIKEIVPIWKKETGPDGASWVDEGA